MAGLIQLAVLPILVFCLAVSEWSQYLFNDKPHPLIPTFAFFAVLGFCVWKGRRPWRELNALILGARGERFVGQMLEKLRAQGYHVFHDLKEDGYNIDHVLIGPGGVFSVETKTHSKPISGNAKVVVEGRKVTVGGWTPDRDPIAQAEAAARRVRAILLAQTGREVSCTPVVLYPGWWVENRNRTSSAVVMNQRHFAKSLPNRPKRLVPDDISFLAAGMARYLTEQQKKR